MSVHIDDVNDNEPICTSPGTIAMSRDMSGSQELFQMERVCSDPDFNSMNGIKDYRLSNLGECIGGKISIWSRLCLGTKTYWSWYQLLLKCKTH